MESSSRYIRIEYVLHTVETQHKVAKSTWGRLRQLIGSGCQLCRQGWTQRVVALLAALH